MLIDSHCHLDDYQDLPAVLATAREAGVRTFLAIGIGDGPETMHRALGFAHQFPDVFATAGIHPQEAHRADAESLRILERLVSDPSCVAVGEIGLDYYNADNPDPPVQQGAFRAQMEIAAEAGKPITIHCRTAELAGAKVQARFGHRDAWEDLLALIAEVWTPQGLPGIMHCFSGDAEQARRSLEAGFYLSFAGNLTYPRNTTLQEIARTAPLDRLLVETDAPFLTPVPLRGQRNQPGHIIHTAAFLAELRGVSREKIAAATTANFQRLFPSAAA